MERNTRPIPDVLLMSGWNRPISGEGHIPSKEEVREEMRAYEASIAGQPGPATEPATSVRIPSVTPAVRGQSMAEAIQQENDWKNR